MNAYANLNTSFKKHKNISKKQVQGSSQKDQGIYEIQGRAQSQ